MNEIFFISPSVYRSSAPHTNIWIFDVIFAAAVVYLRSAFCSAAGCTQSPKLFHSSGLHAPCFPIKKVGHFSVCSEKEWASQWVTCTAITLTQECLEKLIGFYFEQYLPKIMGGTQDKGQLFQEYREIVQSIDQVLEDYARKRQERKAPERC